MKSDIYVDLLLGVGSIIIAVSAIAFALDTPKSGGIGVFLFLGGMLWVVRAALESYRQHLQAKLKEYEDDRA